MSTTRQEAGPHAVAFYVQNAMGRRLLIGTNNGKGYVDAPVLLATTQAEAKLVIATLHQLCEELPP